MNIIRKILFPTDFSANSDHALAHAVRLLDFQGGDLIVQHVVANHFEKHPHLTALFNIHELQKYMDLFVDEEMERTLAPYLNKINTRKIISKGKPVEEIAAVAEQECVDLVVMGAAHGVITNGVIRTTSRPILTIPSNMDPDSQRLRRARKVLVTTDFSDHSRNVVRYAFELKEAFDASIYLLYVIETTAALDFALKQGHYRDAREKMTDWAFNQLCNLIPDHCIGDPRIVRIVEYGATGDAIRKVAREVDPDITILGTHEYGLIRRHLVGTTTDRLLGTLTTPLLTIKL